MQQDPRSLTELFADYVNGILPLTEGEQHDLMQYNARIRIAGKLKTFWEGEQTQLYFTADDDPFKMMVNERATNAGGEYADIRASYVVFMKEIRKKYHG